VTQLRTIVFAMCVAVSIPISNGRAIAHSKVEKTCSVASMKGIFGFSLTGTNVAYNVPFAFVGRATADGLGNFSAKGTQSRGGKILEGVLEGTYTVAADCTGSVSFKFGADPNPGGLNFVLVDDGKQVFFINLGEGTVETGTATLISPH
jgi:hypothetical protein